MSEDQSTQETPQAEDKPTDFSPKQGGKKKRNLPWKPAAGFAAVALLFFAVGFLVPKGSTTGMVTAGSQFLTAEQAGKNAVDYINNYLLQPGFTASLVNASDSNGVYSIKLNITSSQGSSAYDSYVTKDGKILFVSAVDISKTPEAPAEAEQPTAVTKAAKPNVKMFVMSYCPYGEQAENGLGPAVEALGMGNITFEPHFVIYDNYNGGGSNYCFDNESQYCSMHGINEMREDIRQMVIWKYWPDKWWAYVNKVNAETSTGNIETKWKDIATSIGLSPDQIQDHFDKEALSLLAAEAALNAKYGVRGSPTILINDVQYSGGRAPENFKAVICDAFTSPPEGCNETLSAEGASASGSC